MDKLFIEGKEIKPIETELSWFNHDLYKEVTLTFNDESFNVMVLKSDIERLKEQFKRNKDENKSE